jgi:hypothetical protein
VGSPTILQATHVTPKRFDRLPAAAVRLARGGDSSRVWLFPAVFFVGVHVEVLLSLDASGREMRPNETIPGE